MTANAGYGPNFPLGPPPLPEDELPTFEDIRCRAHVLLGDVQDVLRSDWAPGTGPTRGQGHAVHEAFLAIARAKAALDEAAAR